MVKNVGKSQPIQSSDHDNDGPEVVRDDVEGLGSSCTPRRVAVARGCEVTRPLRRNGHTHPSPQLPKLSKIEPGGTSNKVFANLGLTGTPKTQKGSPSDQEG